MVQAWTSTVLAVGFMADARFSLEDMIVTGVLLTVTYIGIMAISRVKR